MKDQREDRRTKRTRKLLQEALIKLVFQKSFEDITVQDIIDEADVGRSTFYAHYLNKEDLILTNFGDMVEGLSQGMELSENSKRDRILPVQELFDHVKDQYQLLQAMGSGRVINLFFQKGHAMWSQMVESRLHVLVAKGHTPHVPLPILANHVAGSLTSMFRWWLDHHMPYPPDRMDQMFHMMVMPGVRAAIGAE